MSTDSTAQPTCNVCGAEALSVVKPYSALRRVSSDCKPVEAGGELSICAACGAVQKQATPQFLAEIGKIYDEYDVYFQGGGAEQMVFDALTRAPRRRSLVLADRLKATGSFPASGRAIDIGCGNGSFLRALSGPFDGWGLLGLELDDRHEAEMRSIPGFQGLLVSDANDLEGTFELVSMVHALEHFTDPHHTLTRLKRNITPGGHLFIEIPNLAANPFDLLIADHVSHFTPASLFAIVERAGFGVVSLATDWVKKEMSLLARPGVASTVPRPAADIPGERHVAWLAATLEAAKSAARSGPFGLFGTSIASTWLSQHLGAAIEFYVDDDTARQELGFEGKPVLSREQVPQGATVFAALSPEIAEVIAGSLRDMGVAVIAPPEIYAA
jgi:SAM-dependent methyltransferase